jgi:hypothetical protein
LKDLGNHQLITESTDKMLRTSRKNYPSHDTVPIMGFSLKKITNNEEGPVTSSVREIRC